MKTQLISKLLILVLLTAAGVIRANAQALEVGTIEADVPFAFTVGQKAFPAGKYTLKRADDTTPGVLEIRNDKGRGTIFFEAQTTEANEYPRETNLVFDKIGDQYFLSEIWASDTKLGYRLQKTHTEKSLEGADVQTELRTIVAKLLRKTKTSK